MNFLPDDLLKPLQNKKGQKIWGTREKSSPFTRKKTAFFSGTPNFFGFWLYDYQMRSGHQGLYFKHTKLAKRN